MRCHLLRLLLGASLLHLFGCSSNSSPPVDSGPNPVNQCLSASDRAIVRPDGGPSMVDGAALSDTGDAVKACALGPCYSITLADGDITGCVKSCLIGTPQQYLSDGCLGCFIDSFNCGRKYCILDCVGSDPNACVTCLDANGCISAWSVCSGLAPL